MPTTMWRVSKIRGDLLGRTDPRDAEVDQSKVLPLVGKYKGRNEKGQNKE